MLLGNGGVVDIISSGLYDTFTISQSFIVKADPGLMATIDAPSSGNGVTVNAPSAMVTVRNLTLHGNGGTGHGFQINCVGRMVVEDCDSRNFWYGLGSGPAGSGELTIKGGTFEGSNTGIYIVSGTAIAVVDGATVYGGTYAGIEASAVRTTITHSFVTGDGVGTGILSNSGIVVLENDVVSRYTTGVVAGYTDALTYLSSCTITDNDFGIAAPRTPYSRGNTLLPRMSTETSLVRSM